MKRVPLVHPWFAPMFPVLLIYSVNMDYFNLKEVVNALVEFFVPGIALWAVVSLALRSIERGAIASTIALGVSFLIGSFRHQIIGAVDQRTHILLSVFVGVLTAIGLFIAMKERTMRWPVAVASALAIFLIADLLLRKYVPDDEMLLRIAWIAWSLGIGVACSRVKEPKVMTVFLNWVVMILFLQPATTIVYSKATYSPSNTKITASNIRPQNGQRLPDIYFIVLDGYARADVLRDQYRLPEDPLAKGLRDRGFFVAECARANYTQTLQSIGATLNMDYLQTRLRVDKNENSRAMLQEHMRENGAMETLKNLGYKTVSILSNPELMPIKTDLSFAGHPRSSRLTEEVVERTPFFAGLKGGNANYSHAQKILGAYQLLDGLAPSDSPRFVFVHIVAPHPPFVFDKDGNIVANFTHTSDGSHYMQEGGNPGLYKSQYRSQLQYIARRTLESIDKLPRHSAILMIQSDHGPKSKLDYESIEKTDFSECLPILCAVSGPDELEANLYHGISSVNTLRLVLGHLKKEDVLLLPDRSYYTTWSHPYDFVDVTKRPKN